MISNRELYLMQQEYEATQEQLDREWNKQEYRNNLKERLELLKDKRCALRELAWEMIDHPYKDDLKKTWIEYIKLYNEFLNIEWKKDESRVVDTRQAERSYPF